MDEGEGEEGREVVMRGEGEGLMREEGRKGEMWGWGKGKRYVWKRGGREREVEMRGEGKR